MFNYIPQILLVNAKNKNIINKDINGKIINIQIIHKGSTFLYLKNINTGNEKITHDVEINIFQKWLISCHFSREEYQS